MEAAQTIRSAVAKVSELRQTGLGNPALGQAIAVVKALQARRFAGTYADLLASPIYGAASRFFLEELYSDKDYTARDAQFARIAGALQSLFPASVVEVAVALAELHVLTEGLDHAMGLACTGGPLEGDAQQVHRYLRAWRAVGRQADRHAQLRAVLEVGRELDRLTRKPGLRIMLKMMRKPAQAAGLSALQNFLEAGFDTFAAMARRPLGVSDFLATIEDRETRLMDLLFDADPVACETHLQHVLNLPR